MKEFGASRQNIHKSLKGLLDMLRISGAVWSWQYERIVAHRVTPFPTPSLPTLIQLNKVNIIRKLPKHERPFMQFKVENKVLISSILLHSNLFFIRRKWGQALLWRRRNQRTKIKAKGERNKRPRTDSSEISKCGWLITPVFHGFLARWCPALTPALTSVDGVQVSV